MKFSYLVAVVVFVILLFSQSRAETSVDMITGDIPLSLPLDPYYHEVNKNNAMQINCIALTAYGEASDQGYDGMLAVAFVVMNRATTSTPCKAAMKKNAFSIFRLQKWKNLLMAAMNGKYVTPELVSELDQIAWENAISAATNAYTKTVNDPTSGALYYYSPTKVKELGYELKEWHLTGEKIVINDHVFLVNNKD